MLACATGTHTHTHTHSLTHTRTHTHPHTHAHTHAHTHSHTHTLTHKHTRTHTHTHTCTHTVIEAELGTSISSLFSEISPHPVAAASLGQVYRAVLRPQPNLPNGAVVAVKVWGGVGLRGCGSRGGVGWGSVVVAVKVRQ